MFTPLNRKINSFAGRILKICLLVSIFLAGLADRVHAMGAPPGGGTGVPTWCYCCKFLGMTANGL